MNVHSKIDLEPDFAVIARYNELLGYGPDEPRHYRFLPDSDTEKKRILDHEKAERIRTGDRKCSLKRNYTGTLVEVKEDMRECQTHDWGIFAPVNRGGRDKASITEIAANFVDGDGIPLPEDWEWHLKPNFIVQRDELHWHAYWRVSDCSLDQFEETQKRLALYYGADPDIHDLPRVMRIPGTWHHKHVDGAPSMLLTLTEYHDNIYTTAEIRAGLAELPAQPERKSEEGAVDDTLIPYAKAVSWLSNLDPGVPEPEWYPIIAAIHSLPLASDADADKRRQLARDWSAGLYDKTGRYDKSVPDNWESEEAVDEVFDRFPPQEGGIGWKTLRHTVRETIGRVHEAFGDTLDDIADGQGQTGKNGTGAKPEEAAEDIRFTFRQQADFKDMPTPVCIIQDVLQEKVTHILFGDSDTAKTFQVLHMAGSIISGLPLYGHFKTHLTGDVVFCESEDATDLMATRWPAWAIAHGIDPFCNDLTRTDGGPKIENPGRLFIVDSVPELKNMQDVELLARKIRKLKITPRLIAIDTLNNAMTELDDNSASDFSLVTRAANFLRKEFGCAILFVDHVRRSDLTSMRGTGAKRNNTDINMCSEGEDWRALKITCTRWKGGPKPKPFHLKGSLVSINRKDRDGRMISAPVLTFNANPKRDLSHEPNGKEQTFKASRVLPALRLLAKQDQLPVVGTHLAEIMNGKEPSDPKEYATWQANVEADRKRLRRGVLGNKPARRKKNAIKQPGFLADLVQRDNEGEPFEPLRFILPEHYRTAPSIGYMPAGDDDTGD